MNPSTPRRDDSGSLTMLVALLVALFATLLVRTAWICDDAYITFRVIDNFWNGYGLRWNVDDRVQAFTHPLWMMLMAVVYRITHDAYYSTLVVSGLLSLGAVLVLARRIALDSAHAALAILALAMSKAFVDYSTAGLENPLQHLLLALLAWQYFAGSGGRRSFLRLSVLAGLITLNRLDSLLLVGPPLAFAAVGRPIRHLLRDLALGFLPLAAWTVFAFVYYGFPFPNTAYAKLNTGIAAGELAQQGVYYLFNSLSFDPLTLVVIVLALAAPFVLRFGAAAPWALGILIELAYIVRVGGDFMSGRFLALPLLASVILLARAPVASGPLPVGLTFVAMSMIALTSPVPNLEATAHYFVHRSERRNLLDGRGITDERAIYYRYTGLMSGQRGDTMPNHHRAAQGRQLRAEGQTFFTHGQIGILGFFAGPGVHILDQNALTDAFLARLPAAPGWRIGHFARQLPEGYEASLRKHVNRIADEELRRLYQRVSLVVSGPIFDAARWGAIWDMNFGAGRRLAEGYFRIQSRAQKATIAEFATPRADGTDWLAGRRFGQLGLQIDLAGLHYPENVELSLDGNDAYKLSCVKLGVLVAAVDVPARPLPEGGLSIRTVRFGGNVPRWGCDELWIAPVTGDLNFSLGHLRILSERHAQPSEETLAAPEPLASDPPDEGEDGKQNDRLPGGR